MSLLSDVFHGDIGNIGNDITGMFRPNEIASTLEGAAAVALPFAAPAIAGLFGAGDAVGAAAGAGGSIFDSLFGGGGAAAADAGSILPYAATDATTAAGGGASGAISSALGSGAGASPFSLGDFNGLAPEVLNYGNAASGAVSGAASGATSGAGSALGDITSLTSNLNFASDPGAIAPGASGASNLQSLTDPAYATLSGGANSAGGAAPAGGQTFLDKLVSGVTNASGNALDSIAKNPLGVGAATVGLGYNLLQGQKTLPNQNALQSEVSTLTPQAQQFMGYLASGTLPPGLQAVVTQTSQARKAQIIANAARNGQSTDPTQNSALGQDLAAVDQQALIAVAQQGEALFQTGLSEAQLSSSIMQGLLGVEQQQTASMGKAISNFASALSGGVRTTTTTTQA